MSKDQHRAFRRYYTEMTSDAWSVTALRLYYPESRTNVAHAVGDLLSLRGIRVTPVGRPSALDFRTVSGRKAPYSFILDPHRVWGRGDSTKPVHAAPRPSAGRYFVYITEPLPRRGTHAHARFVEDGIPDILDGALCAYTTFLQNLDGHPAACTTRVLPPPLVAFDAPASRGRASDIVFLGTPDSRQGSVIKHLRREWRVRSTGGLCGRALTEYLAGAQAVILPRSSNERHLPVCKMSEVILSGAPIVAEAPSLERPRLYDERVTYIDSNENMEVQAKLFSTALTAAMLGKRSQTSEEEIKRVEMALLHVTYDSLLGLGRPGPLPGFIAAVQRWLAMPSIHATVKWLSHEPASWHALKTRTITDVARSIPPIAASSGPTVTTVCLYSGDPEACVASVRAVTAAFPQHQHSVCCPQDSTHVVANSLAAARAEHVNILAVSPEAGESGGWRARVRAPELWEKLDTDFILVYSDALLLRCMPLGRYMGYDVVQYSDEASDLHVALVRREALIRGLRGGPIERRGAFIPEAGLNAPPPHKLARFSNDIFPGASSLIPGENVGAPPGVRIGIVDSFHAEAQGPGRWVSSVLAGLLSITGTQLSVFSAMPTAAWVRDLQDAWGQRQPLHGLVCLPLDATDLIRENDFDLIVDVAGQRGPRVRRRLCPRQWLMCMDPLRERCAWWKPGAVRQVFDRVLVGSAANYARAEEQGISSPAAARELLGLVPVPSYLPLDTPATRAGSANRFACIVTGSEDGCVVARAFRHAELSPSIKLTILFEGKDPAELAEIQGACGNGVRAMVPPDGATRTAIIRDAKHLILLEGASSALNSAGMPDQVLLAIRCGCTPIWRKGSAAGLVFVDRVHGAEFSGQEEFAAIVKHASAGGTLGTAEGAEDCLGMLSMHTRAGLRHALLSMILGGRGAVDSDLLGDFLGDDVPEGDLGNHVDGTDVAQPDPALPSLESVMMDAPSPLPSYGVPAPLVTKRAYRRRRMGLGFQAK